MTGKNPYDHFRGREVLDPKVFSVGGKRSHKDFAKWLSNQAGAGILHRFRSNDSGKVKTELEKLIGYPISSNILGRFIKVSDSGIREELNDELEEVRKIADEKTILANEGIQKILENKELTDKESMAIIEKIGTIEKTYIRALGYKYGSVYMEKILGARSNKEKIIILNRMIKDPIANPDLLETKKAPVPEPTSEPTEKAPENTKLIDMIRKQK